MKKGIRRHAKNVTKGGKDKMKKSKVINQSYSVGMGLGSGYGAPSTYKGGIPKGNTCKSD
jgi:hypothetical protein